jgi:hypothetical protein
MNKILLIVFTVGIHIFSHGQPPTPGSYEPNSNVDKLVGIWRWTSGTEVFELKLQKLQHDNGVYITDVILGSHIYIRNGVTIESSMSGYNNIVADHKKATAYIYNINMGPDNFEGLLKDISKGKSVTIKLLFIPGSPSQIEMHLEPAEGIATNPNFQYGVTVPTDLILIKQYTRASICALLDLNFHQFFSFFNKYRTPA